MFLIISASRPVIQPSVVINAILSTASSCQAKESRVCARCCSGQKQRSATCCAVCAPPVTEQSPYDMKAAVRIRLICRGFLFRELLPCMLLLGSKRTEVFTPCAPWQSALAPHRLPGWTARLSNHSMGISSSPAAGISSVMSKEWRSCFSSSGRWRRSEPFSALSRGDHLYLLQSSTTHMDASWHMVG